MAERGDWEEGSEGKGTVLYYRGSLKSCNYSCSYCPFGKRKLSQARLEADKTALFRFVQEMEQNRDFAGGIQIVPYGEALIHPYYWEGLARLSRHPGIQAVGAQSNFSFSAEKMLERYRERGGIPGKLRLWGTFHPDMVSLEEFLAACRELSRQKILYCVGAVGVPENLALLRRLREELPRRVYLWINRMDGLGREYTLQEAQAFQELDGYFPLQLQTHRADVRRCRGLFVEADGRVKACNLCRRTIGSLYDGPGELGRLLLQEQREKGCDRRYCSCYLAYCNRIDIEELRPFQPYPAFRIPQYFREAHEGLFVVK